MSRPALIDKLMQAGEWLLKPGLVPVDDVTIKRNQTTVYVALDALIRQGGGLAVGKDKRIYVDFSLMPTDAFEELLKSIRVPVWLTGNKNFYVNGETGSDTLDSGRGESVGKPFKTIQAAYNFIADNYNLGPYNLTISIESGIYAEQVRLAGYNASTGLVRLVGNGSVTISGAIVVLAAMSYDLRALSVSCAGEPLEGSSFWAGILASRGSSLSVQGCAIDASVSMDGNKYPVRADASTITYREENAITGDFSAAFFATNAATMNIMADTSINGSATSATVYLTNLSTLSTNSSFEGRNPIISGSVTGKRYSVYFNSICNTGGGGPEYFPGSVQGNAVNGGQYA